MGPPTPEDSGEVPSAAECGAPSIDAQLASGALDLLTPSDGASSEARGALYGRDTLITARERPELLKAMHRPPGERHASHVRLIAEIMARTSLAASQGMAILHALAKRVLLATCEKGRAVVVEGEAGEHMYMLVSGSCVIEKADRRGNNRVVRAMEVGQCFGELALQVAGGTRAATVRATEAVECFVICGHTYRRVLARHHREDMNNRVKLLFRLPVFKGIPVPLLRELASIMERRTYRLGSFIFRQGENANSMFVLASGSVRIVRQMRVSDGIAKMHRLDPMTMRLLEPQREDEERFAPFPQRSLCNGRPRSMRVPRQEAAAARLTQALAPPAAGQLQRCATQRRLRTQRTVKRGGTAGGDGGADLADALASESAVAEDKTGELALAQSKRAAGGTQAYAEAVPVPGLELSGVTAEDLDEAGVLYNEERHLLGPAAAAPPAPAPAPAAKLAWSESARFDAAGATPEPEQPEGLSRPASCEGASSSKQKMWMELTTMRAPDYFGEAAMLGRGVRHAAAIADSAVEVLVLLKLDFDLKIDAATREVLNVLVSQYPKDATFVRDMTQKARWEQYKKDTVQHVLSSAKKEHLLTQCSDCLFRNAWTP